MLQPNHRFTLIDSMRPPAGFVLDAAVGVTFTLDLRALLAAPAAFALTGASSPSSDDAGGYEPIELLHALRVNASKLTVFSQVGEIALPPSRRVFAFLERTVIPVSAPAGGVVHPKVWALRYSELGEGVDGPRESRLRVLVGSRNLTFDASWDTVVRLDESATGRGARLDPVAELFERLLDATRVTVSAEHSQRVRSVAAALRAARFSLPPGVEALHAHVFGFTDTPSPLPRHADRSLIISPFLGDDFLRDVRPAPVTELVSRPESLDALGPTALDRIGTAYSFDDGSSVDLDAATERLSPYDPGRPLIGLHAKVFAFEHDRRATLFLGSANATAAAFTRNVELLLELRGPVKTLGIDRLCNGNAEEPTLRSLFAPYLRAEVADDDPDASALDHARHAIAQLAIDGFVEESTSGWAVTYRSQEPLPAITAGSVHCWPLTSPGNRRQVAAGEPLEARFETSLEAIIGFLAFELEGIDGRLTQFVVPAPLHGVPEQRERLLLAALIGSAGRFLRYLLAQLDESEPDDRVALPPTGPESDPHGDWIGGNGLPVLEKLLRTVRRNPAKLVALHPLVSDLAADDALPDGFSTMWKTIYAIAMSGAER